eukprot:6208105-Pleurochrysis_carterae.AAC.1
MGHVRSTQCPAFVSAWARILHNTDIEEHSSVNILLKELMLAHTAHTNDLAWQGCSLAAHRSHVPLRFLTRANL